MALLKKEHNAAVVPAESQKLEGGTGRKKPKILDEDTFVDRIEKIIERDFFPDLTTLNIQKAYFDALERNDLVKLRELQMKYGGQCPTSTRIPSEYNTPSSFETPEVVEGRTGSQSVASRLNSEREEEVERSWNTEEKPSGSVTEPEEPSEGLDSFLAKNTSEDNASFAEILVESERKRREKHAWLFENENKQDQEQKMKLALPSIEEQAVIKPRPALLDTWTYKSNNSVMYVPEGVEYSAKELIEMNRFKKRAIQHENTHFSDNPFGTIRSKEALQKATVYKALINHGKIGHDGRELTLQTPQVNGFTFVGTPSPAPGVGESPIMTWGEVEGTPMQLDGHPACTPGPVFKIPDVPKRDQLALALAEKASKAHRAKKEAALKHVTRRLASPSPNMSPLERFSGMSPAAQRLASKRLGVRTHADTALQASYSPSPVRSSADKTPVHFSSVPSPASERSSASTPGSKQSSTNTNSPDKGKPSITDDLLQLPKRQKASDFF